MCEARCPRRKSPRPQVLRPADPAAAYVFLGSPLRRQAARPGHLSCCVPCTASLCLRGALRFSGSMALNKPGGNWHQLLLMQLQRNRQRSGSAARPLSSSRPGTWDGHSIKLEIRNDIVLIPVIRKSISMSSSSSCTYLVQYGLSVLAGGGDVPGCQY